MPRTPKLVVIEVGHRTSSLYAGVALLAGVLLGCGAEPSAGFGARSEVLEWPGDTTVIRTVMESSVPHLPVTETVRFGAFEGPDEYLFSNVTELVPREDGHVYVWDRGRTLLRQFDQDGEYVRNVGGAGSGPGEYRAALGMSISDGLLVLWDAGNGRINVYDTAGTYVDSWQFFGRGDASLGILQDATGQLYIPTSMTESNVLGRLRLEDGDLTDTISIPRASPGDGRLQAISPDGGTMVRRDVPLLPREHVVFHPGGGFVRGWSGEYRLDIHSADGEVRRILVEDATLSVSAAMRSAMEDELSSAMRRTNPEWTWEGPRVPSQRPSFLGVEVGTDGTIWVRRSLATEESMDPAWYMSRATTERPETFDVFGPGGTFCGRVSLPSDVNALRMDGREIWGVARDSVDVPYIVRLAVNVLPTSECWN